MTSVLICRSKGWYYTYCYCCMLVSKRFQLFAKGCFGIDTRMNGHRESVHVWLASAQFCVACAVGERDGQCLTTALNYLFKNFHLSKTINGVVYFYWLKDRAQSSCIFRTRTQSTESEWSSTVTTVKSSLLTLRRWSKKQNSLSYIASLVQNLQLQLHASPKAM